MPKKGRVIIPELGFKAEPAGERGRKPATHPGNL